ncbi:MAG TPA: SHOCT domain-containing protein [Streptosporangiaceae bacterium]|nr:SHOCT domain-containing protein [Streptosporangiaceae bacterium]
MRRRPLLRAAVVGGGAYVAGKHMANKANEQASNEAYQNQRIDQLEQQQPQYQDQQQYAPPQQQAPPPDAAPAAGPSMADQLQQIASLHQQGVLSDDEFAAAKAKLLGT